MKKANKDRVLNLEKDVNENGEAIQETVDAISDLIGNVIKMVHKILDNFDNESRRNVNKVLKEILDNSGRLLSQQKTLVKISSQLIENFDKTNHPAAIGQDM